MWRGRSVSVRRAEAIAKPDLKNRFQVLIAEPATELATARKHPTELEKPGRRRRRRGQAESGARVAGRAAAVKCTGDELGECR